MGTYDLESSSQIFITIVCESFLVILSMSFSHQIKNFCGEKIPQPVLKTTLLRYIADASMVKRLYLLLGYSKNSVEII